MYSRRYIRRNRVVPSTERERTRQIFCAYRDVRAYNVATRSPLPPNATRPRGRMKKYESFLRAINASAYSQGRPCARCCIHLFGGAAPHSRLSLSVIISWNPARRTERAKRGSKNASIDRNEREPGIRRASRDIRLSRDRVIPLLRAMKNPCARKTKYFQSVFCFDTLLAFCSKCRWWYRK